MRYLIFVCCALVTVGRSQPTQGVPLSYYLPQGAVYDPSIPTPQQFFGFQVGEWHLSPEQIHAYFRELGRLSDRFSVRSMGRSHEKREIMLAVITSPANHASLEAIRTAHVSLSDPGSASTVDITASPVVVWMGYSVHGNEASGSNASVLVAYYLAAARGPDVEDMLSQTIVLMNPSINPDGLNRFSSWVNANKGSVVDPSPDSREHREPWPGGRTNHYWFDLNRDWMPLQHPESRARMEQYYQWRPNVLTDHHEMGTNSTFFFQPGIQTRNNPLVPQSVSELTARIARFHAKALDSIGSLYYTEESFDDFYVGKGSSYPDITGGIGILFEQASSRGHAQKTATGTLAFPYAIKNHVTASFSTLEGARANRRELLEHQRMMARSALELAGRSKVQAYVFGSETDRARTKVLADILSAHGIVVRELSQEVRAGGVRFAPGSAFIVPVRQVQYRLITSLFERRTEFVDSLFYDVSSWSLPLAFGLPHAELSSMSGDLTGKVYDPRSVSSPISLPPPVPIYAFEWDEFYAPRALLRLFDRGLAPRMAFQAFTAATTAGERTFRRGTIVLPVGVQKKSDAEIRTILEEIRKEDGLPVWGITSGLTPSGIDLGSPNVVALERPAVALLTGPGVSVTDAGEIWHLLDHRYGAKVTLLDQDMVRGTVLREFNVLIMPAGRYASIDPQQLKDLTSWVQEGNTLIVLEQAVEWAIRSKIAGATLRKRSDRRLDTTVTVLYSQEEDVRGARNVPGSIVSATGDETHPLLFAVGARDLFLFKSTPHVFEPSHRTTFTPILYSRSPLVGGYLHKDLISSVSGGAAVAVSSLGRGKTILVADNPVFRAFWFETSRIFTNAVFIGRYIRVPESVE